MAKNRQRKNPQVPLAGSYRKDLKPKSQRTEGSLLQQRNEATDLLGFYRGLLRRHQVVPLPRMTHKHKYEQTKGDTQRLMESQRVTKKAEKD